MIRARKPSKPVDRAFDAVYRRHAAEVYRYALAILERQADAEDATQATFLNAYRAMQRGEHPRDAGAWLRAIALNVCREHYRRAGRRAEEVSLDDDPADLVQDPATPDLTDVMRGLAALPFNQRAALVMREFEGRSLAEIAVALEVSSAAVEALLFRARRGLREQLEGTLTCGEAELAISRQLDRALPRAERGLLRAHLRACPECASLARRMRAQRTAFKSLVALPIPLSIRLGRLFGGEGWRGPAGSVGSAGAGGAGSLGSAVSGSGPAAGAMAGSAAAKLAGVVAAGAVAVGASYSALHHVSPHASGTRHAASAPPPATAITASAVPAAPAVLTAVRPPAGGHRRGGRRARTRRNAGAPGTQARARVAPGGVTGHGRPTGAGSGRPGQSHGSSSAGSRGSVSAGSRGSGSAGSHGSASAGSRGSAGSHGSHGSPAAGSHGTAAGHTGGSGPAPVHTGGSGTAAHGRSGVPPGRAGGRGGHETGGGPPPTSQSQSGGGGPSKRPASPPGGGVAAGRPAVPPGQSNRPSGGGPPGGGGKHGGG